MRIEMRRSMRISYEKLHRYCVQIFEKYGFSGEDSQMTADVLLQADLFGIESHGISRIRKYIDLLDEGIIQVDAKPEIIRETPLSAVIDVHSAIGQPQAVKAMQMAIKKAKEHGIGMVQLRGGNHYGIAGYYALLAAREGLLGISMTNTAAIMVPTFSAQALLGSNPIAFAMPKSDGIPFLYDGATTVITRGKVELYDREKKQLKEGWTVGASGKIETDPGTVLTEIRQKSGGILPVGGAGETYAGYKGFGYAMMCEIMTSILSGGVSAIHKKERGDTSQCFYAIDYGMFGDKAETERRMQQLADDIHGAAKADGCSRIYIAGEKEFDKEKENRRLGVPISEKSYLNLCEAGKHLGIPKLQR